MPCTSSSEFTPLILHAQADAEGTESSSQRQAPPSTAEQQDSLAGQEGAVSMEKLSRKSQWIILALASGGCAAFNGVFAKLTTTELTTTLATCLANIIGLGGVEAGVEVGVRALFFALNLVFNGIMWTLFTKALARGSSTTQVSIVNTSANFMVTAVMGWLVFSESLPPLWFAGAALLVAGNVIIGRREEGEAKIGDGVVGEERREGEGLLAEELELESDADERKSRREEEDVLLLDLDDRAGREGS